MCVWLCIVVFVCRYIVMCVRVCVWLFVYVWVCSRVCVRVFVCSCVYLCVCCSVRFSHLYVDRNHQPCKLCVNHKTRFIQIIPRQFNLECNCWMSCFNVSRLFGHCTNFGFCQGPGAQCSLVVNTNYITMSNLYWCNLWTWLLLLVCCGSVCGGKGWNGINPSGWSINIIVHAGNEGCNLSPTDDTFYTECIHGRTFAFLDNRVICAVPITGHPYDCMGITHAGVATQCDTCAHLYMGHWHLRQPLNIRKISRLSTEQIMNQIVSKTEYQSL